MTRFFNSLATGVRSQAVEWAVRCHRNRGDTLSRHPSVSPTPLSVCPRVSGSRLRSGPNPCRFTVWTWSSRNCWPPAPSPTALLASDPFTALRPKCHTDRGATRAVLTQTAAFPWSYACYSSKLTPPGRASDGAVASNWGVCVCNAVCSRLVSTGRYFECDQPCCF